MYLLMCHSLYHFRKNNLVLLKIKSTWIKKYKVILSSYSIFFSFHKKGVHSNINIKCIKIELPHVYISTNVSYIFYILKIKCVEFFLWSFTLAFLVLFNKHWFSLVKILYFIFNLFWLCLIINLVGRQHFISIIKQYCTSLIL